MTHEAPKVSKTIDWDSDIVKIDEQKELDAAAEAERAEAERVEVERKFGNKVKGLIKGAEAFGFGRVLRPQVIDGRLYPNYYLGGKSKKNVPGLMLEVPYPVTGDSDGETITLIPKKIGKGFDKDTSEYDDSEMAIAVFGVVNDPETGDPLPPRQLFAYFPFQRNARKICVHNPAEQESSSRGMAEVYGTESHKDWQQIDPTDPENIAKVKEFEGMINAISVAMAEKCQEKVEAEYQKKLARIAKMRGEIPQANE